MTFLASRILRALVPLALILSVAFSFFPGVIHAQTGAPKIINYQARLLDSNGNLLGGSGTQYCFTFSFYDTPTQGTGTKLWPTNEVISTSTVTVRNGVFNVGIGDTSVGGNTLDFDFQSTDTVYLNVQVASKVGATCAPGDGAEVYEDFSTRPRINSSGFALNANTVGGFSASQAPTGDQIPVLSAGNLIMGGNIFATSAGFTNATTTNATSTNLAVTGSASTSNLVVSNGFTFGNFTGILKAVAGAVVAALVDLATDVTGILAVEHGGTGWAHVASGAVLFGNGSGALATTTAGTPGYVLSYLNGVPTWTATSTYAFPLVNTGNTVSLSFGTTTANTWGTTQTFSDITAGTASIGTLTATSSALLASTTAQGRLITGNIVATSSATSTFAGPVAIGTTSTSYLVSVFGTTTGVTSATGTAIMAITNTSASFSSANNVLRLNVGTPHSVACTSGTTCPRFIEYFAGVPSGRDTGGRGVGSLRLSNTGTGITQTSGAADFAEFMVLSEAASEGDIVSLNSSGQYQRAVAGQSLIGVISNNPAFVGNANLEGQTNAYIVGFAGVVETTVSTANGAIAAGDLITVGSTPGVGVKLTTSGYAVGQALESYSSGGNGAIDVLVFPKYVDAVVALEQYGGSQGGISGYFTLATSTRVVSLASTTYSFHADNATTTNATTTNFAVTGSATSTFGGGINLNTGCFSIGGFCIGLGSSFSTTSANYWETTQWRWSTSSTDFWQSQRNFFSTTSADAWDATKWRWSTSSSDFAVNAFIHSSSTIPKTFASNSWSLLQLFSGGASTTNLSVFNTLFIGGSATTTIQGDVAGTSTIQGFINVTGQNSTSTFSGRVYVNGQLQTDGDLAAARLNISGAATSTFAQGINISDGCFAINGTCVGGGSVEGGGGAGSGVLLAIQVFSTPGAATYYRSSGATTAQVIVTGAGGGGGGADNFDGTTTESAGGGGGAGGTTIELIDLTGITSVPVTVGTGGSGGTAAGGNGNPGGDSYFGDMSGAYGGGGGVGAPQSASTAACAHANSLGDGGSGGAASSTGSLYMPGGDGTTVQFCLNNLVHGGNGGASYWGGQVEGGVREATGGCTAGNAGVAYGTGGGGAACVEQINGALGGNGANGVVVVYEYGPFQGAASTTALSALDYVAVGRTSTTTIRGDSATSTFSWGVQALALNITGSATSTFGNGINLNTGCFSIAGTCIGGGTGTADGSFSTTSADYWQSQRNFFSTTSVDAWKEQRNFFSTTSANAWEATQWRWATTSADWWLSQYTKGYFFSTSSADAWDTTKWRWSTSSSDFAVGQYISGSSTVPHVGGSAYGDILSWSGSSWTSRATSSLGVDLGDTTGVLDITKGGTGQITYTKGDILYSDANGSLAVLPIGASGEVLKVQSGVPFWGIDLTTGGGGGGGLFSTTTDNLVVYNTYLSKPVVIGDNATSSDNQSVFEVSGKSYFSDVVSIGSTTPGSIFSINSVANFAQTGSTFYSPLTALATQVSQLTVSGDTMLSGGATTSALAITNTANALLAANGDGSVINAIIGGSLSFSANTLGLNLSNANTWSGLQTFNGGASTTNISASGTAFLETASTTYLSVVGQATSSFGGGINLATGCFSVAGQCIGQGGPADGTFSTTSADYWKVQRNFFSTTSADAWKAERNFYSTTSADAWDATKWRWSTSSSDFAVNTFIHGSTTIGKLFTANTWTALQTFSAGASTTNLSVSGTAFLQTASTTYLSVVGQATSTFSWGVDVRSLNITGSATSTSANGLDLSGGCFSIKGTCIGGGGSAAAGAQGNIQFYSGGSLGAASNFTWNDTTKRLGVGTSTPWAKLSISANANEPISDYLFLISSSTASATSTLFSVARNGVTSIGDPTGTGDAAMQFAGDANAWTIGYASTTKKFQIASSTALGGSNIYFEISKNGMVGIGTTTFATSSQNLKLIVGTNAASGPVAQFGNSTGVCTINPNSASLLCSSDARLKKNVEHIASSTSPLRAILALNPMYYNWNTETDDVQKHAGFIAQEVDVVLPDIVEQDSFGFYTMNYAGLTPYLTGAVQELSGGFMQLASSTASSTESLLGRMLVLSEQVSSLASSTKPALSGTVVADAISSGSVQADSMSVSGGARIGHATTTSLSITSIYDGLVAVRGDGSVVTARFDGSLVFADNTLSLDLSNANIWTGLQRFGYASTTALSADEYVAIGGSATTTLRGDGATSTFAGAIEAPVLSISSTTATSTFAGGINVTGGCVAVDGECIGGDAQEPDTDKLAYELLDSDPQYFGHEASTSEEEVRSGPLDFIGAVMNAIASRLSSLAGIKPATTTAATSSGMALLDTLRFLRGDSATTSQLAALSIALVRGTSTDESLAEDDSTVRMRVNERGELVIERVGTSDLKVLFEDPTSAPNALLVTVDKEGNASFAGTVLASGLTIGTSARPAGITLYDEETGEPYCSKVVGGVLRTFAGKCGEESGTSQTAAAASSEPFAASAAPIIQIQGNNPAYIDIGTVYNDLGATVTDDHDHNLGLRIYVDGAYVEQVELDTSTSTVYTIRYEATDNDGIVGTARRVVVVGDGGTGIEVPSAGEEGVPEEVPQEESGQSPVQETEVPVAPPSAESASTSSPVETSTPPQETEPSDGAVSAEGAQEAPPSSEGTQESVVAEQEVQSDASASSTDTEGDVIN